MLLPAQLLLPQQTFAKPGAVRSLISEASDFGSHGLLVHGSSLERSGKKGQLLSDVPAHMKVDAWQHEGGEPTIQAVEALRAAIRRNRPDWVAAIGGGSVIDLAKAAAGLADAPDAVAFYQTHAGDIPGATLPFIAVPTTAGTGSEATVVAVLTDPERRFKQSIRHPSFMPRRVILDPELLTGCPPTTIATAGLDAFIQAFESYTSRYATPFSRTLAKFALLQISQSLLPFYRGDLSHAAPLLEASYIAGLAFSHSRLGVIHGLAHPLGARFQIAHGLTCACCLPAALAFNRAYVARDLEDLRSNHQLDIEAQVAQWLQAMSLDNPFSGSRVNDRSAFIQEVLASGSTGANPRPVTADDAADLLDQILR